MSMIEPGLPQETVLLYKLSVNKQLHGKHEQTDLLENIGYCFLFLSIPRLFSSVSALDFRDYMHKVDMDSILFKNKQNPPKNQPPPSKTPTKTADFWFVCIYFYTYFGDIVKDVSNL